MLYYMQLYYLRIHETEFRVLACRAIWWWTVELSTVECVAFQLRVTSPGTWWQSAELGLSLTFGQRAANTPTLL